MSVVPGSFGANLLARTSNLKALTIGQLRAEEKTLRLVVFNISKTLQKQLLRQGSPRKAQGNTANTRAQIALFQNRLTLVIREIQNRGQQQKLIGDMRDQPFTENGITTSTSQFVLGSTIGAVSSTGSGGAPTPLGIFFTLSRGAYKIENGRIQGETLIIATSKANLNPTSFTPFNFLTNISVNGRNLVSKSNTVRFNAQERDERIQINEFVGDETRVTVNQVVLESSTALSKTLIFNVEAKILPPIPETKECNCRGVIKMIPKFQPCPECGVMPCPTGFHRDPITMQCIEDQNGNGNGDEEGRNLFQSAIIGVLALGALGGSLLDKRRKK